MLLKKIVIFTLLSVVGQQVLANDFYVGAGAGISSSNDKQTMTVQGQAPITHDFGAISFTGSALGGYNFDFNNGFNLGLETFFTMTPKKSTAVDPPNSSYPSRTEDFSLRYAYGVRALPGYKMLPNVLGYAILGVTRGSFSLNDTGAYSVTSNNFGVYGYQLGLGTSTTLLKNLDARLDFIYTQYADHTTNAINTYGLLAGSPMTYLDSPSSFSATLSFTYKFNI